VIESAPVGGAPRLELGTLKRKHTQTQEPGDGNAEGTPGVEHIGKRLADQPESGWFGVADPVAEILANPWRLFDLVGACFEVATPCSGLPVGTRGRVLGLRSDAEALWADVLLTPLPSLLAPPGCVGLTSRRAYRDAFQVPFFLRLTRPVEVVP